VGRRLTPLHPRLRVVRQKALAIGQSRCKNDEWATGGDWRHFEDDLEGGQDPQPESPGSDPGFVDTQRE